MNSPRVRITNGASSIYASQEDVRVRLTGPGGDGQSFAEFTVSSEEMASNGIDLNSELQVFFEWDEQSQLRFTGYVDHALPDQKGFRIRLVTPLASLAESRSGALEIGAGADGLDIIWSLLRASGMPEGRIDLDGFVPGPTRDFEIAVPVDGVELNSPLHFGGVRFIPTSEASLYVANLTSPYLLAICRDAPTWAVARKEGRSFWDAETVGLQSIQVALSWLELRYRYSFPTLPSGRPIAFRRRWKAIEVEHRDCVVVREQRSGRWWARQLTDWVEGDHPRSNELFEVDQSMNPEHVSPELQYALTMWRRANRERDSLSAIVMLWQTIEFFANMEPGHTQKVFSGGERKRISALATTGLERAKKERVEEVLSMLDQKSLMLSLEESVRYHGVPISQEEWKVLRLTRGVRNDFVHGRRPRHFSQSDLIVTLSVSNRMIMSRIARISGQTPAS